jgi:hypothetical protein
VEKNSRNVMAHSVSEPGAPLEQQLEDLGAQLDWARGYL